MEGNFSARTILFLGAIIVASAIGSAIAPFLMQTAAGLLASSSPSCNVLDLQVYGNIVNTRADISVSDTLVLNDAAGTVLTPNYTVATDVEYGLKTAAENPDIKALVIDVDSYGGGSEAGQEIANAIRAFGKPSVAVIHGGGVSAGYLVAAAADRILALENSTVGSIGVTYSFLNQSEKNKKDGIVYEQLSSGPFKDTFSPDKPITDAERELIRRDLDILRKDFVARIAAYRRLPVEKVDALADGSTMLGAQALESGLIDGIGGSKEALAHLEETIGEPVSLCWQ
ncbi:MAG: S49 family peptidase [Patescibacteria group bacterium]